MIDLYKCGFIYFNHPILRLGEFLVLSSQAGLGRHRSCSRLSLTCTAHSPDDLSMCGVCVVIKCSPGTGFNSLSKPTPSSPFLATAESENVSSSFSSGVFCSSEEQWHPTLATGTGGGIQEDNLSFPNSPGELSPCCLLPSFQRVMLGTGATVLWAGGNSPEDHEEADPDPRHHSTTQSVLELPLSWSC